jgi:SPP1 gp7 family putative phage head morphogenesis protein
MEQLLHIGEHNHITSVLSVYERASRYDPTRTLDLRNAFAKEMKLRFKELSKVVVTSIRVNDCFGLKKPAIKLHQMTPAPQDAFNFARNSQKVEEFMKWLKEQEKKGIITVKEYEQIGLSIEGAWTNLYIADSYKRGIIRARDEMRAAGMDIPSMLETGGIAAYLMSGPFHMDRVGVLFMRTYTDLQGITSAMDSIISRILAQGMIDGDGPILLARKLVAAIEGRGMGSLGIVTTTGRFIPAAQRAVLLARTEIIRAHHLAMIQEYRNWGVLNIKVRGEWKTAGDDRVCEKCAPLDGQIFDLDTIENMIPYHPQCRCIALPWIEELQPYYKN